MKRKRTTTKEADSAYFLKVLLYLVLGTIWVKYNGYVVFPVGLILGVLFAQHDHFAIDRKIEYVMLIIASLLGLIGYGVFLSI